jgi:hypothetical protein
MEDQYPMYIYEHSHITHECDAAGVWAPIHTFDVANVPIAPSNEGTITEPDRLSAYSRSSVSIATSPASSGDTQYSPQPSLFAVQPSRLFIANALERRLDHRLDRLWGNYKTFANVSSKRHRVTALFGRTFSELFRISKQLAENVQTCL